MLGSFLFISVTLRLKVFFRNDIINDAVFSIGRIAFIYVDKV